MASSRPTKSFIAFSHQSVRAASVGVLCLALGLGCIAPTPAHAAAEESDLLFGQTALQHGIPVRSGPDLEASYASVLDEGGDLCFGRRATDQAQIASLTKIMTAIVALETLSPDAAIKVTPTAASVGESSAGLMQGDVMTLDASLKALLTASGNDAATALAEAAGTIILADQGLSGDGYACQAAFVDAMNAKGSALGLVNTCFTNPHGLDFDAWAQGQYSCAQDVAVMLRYGMGIERFRASIGFSNVDIAVNRNGSETTLSLSNTDTMLQTYEGTCAAKTGYTLAAGPCVATAVNRGDGHEYYAVVLDSSSKPQRFADSETLYDWTYATRETRATLPWHKRIGLWIDYALDTAASI
ncbi:MAG: D-alanyl-D-alanine carboxypeptidase [Gordonibacter sp.]